MNFIEEWASWIITTTAAAAVALWTRMFFMSRELVRMHRAPDMYGFGSAQLIELTKLQHTTLCEMQKDNKEQFAAMIRNSETQTHYMRWFVAEMSGKNPPPYIERDS